MIMNTAVAVTELFVTSREAGSPFHCFGTMLKVEGLEKRLVLGLARSRSRSRGKYQTPRSRGIAGRSWSRLGPNTKCFGLVS